MVGECPPRFLMVLSGLMVLGVVLPAHPWPLNLAVVATGTALASPWILVAS